MRLFSKTASKPNYLFGLLPAYFKENDSYKNGNNEGLLERYLENFCNEIDQQVVPYLDNIAYIVSAQDLSSYPGTNPNRFLTHLGDVLGNPPDINKDDTYYRILLAHAIMIYRAKGTKKALAYYLGLLGYQITTLSETIGAGLKYDNSLLFDNGLYFDSGCVLCSSYTLLIGDLPGTAVKNPDAARLLLIKTSIETFINPVNVLITSITYA
jgi:hypothetical protein